MEDLIKNERILGSGRHLIFSNGEIYNPKALMQWIRTDDYLIGVDGGTNHIVDMGLTPHVVIGDLDSIHKKTAEFVNKSQIKTISYPENKDKTDLELALDHSIILNPKEIILVAGLGGRIDHIFGNLMLMHRPDLRNKRVEFFDGNSRLILVSPESQVEIEAEPGSLFSVVPLTADVQVAELSGAQWNLSKETLFLGTARGISNVFKQNKVQLSIKRGLAVLILPSSKI